jgi:hypothetical protein
MPIRWPDTFVVGAPRCGTSAMHGYLGQHPQIYMSPRKEPLFFAPDLPGLPGDRIGEPHAYLALFEDATDQRRIGEASPYYLYSAHASDAIGRQCQDARIIIMLRNPADMMYSMYWAWSYAGFENSPSFEAAIDREPDPAGTQARFILNYRGLTRYCEHVERYLGAFGGSRVHVVVFDDLVRDPSGAYRDVCQFLDVDLDHQPRFALSPFRRAASRKPRSRHLAHFLSSSRSTPYGFVGRRIAALARDATRRWGSVPPPPLRAELRRRIQREYEPEVRRLGQLIGRDLSPWSR